MREKSTTVFESSSTTDQSPALKPSFTKHRKGKRITWWHLMFSPILMRGSWWTHTYPFWGFILTKIHVQDQFHCMILQANHSQKWWCDCIIASVPFAIYLEPHHFQKDGTTKHPIPFPSSFAAKMTTSSWKISLKARNVAVHCFHEELGRMSCSQGLAKVCKQAW